MSRISPVPRKYERHGKTHTAQYRSYLAMLGRCYDPKNKKYHLYGGKGIAVCDNWLNSYQSFFDDMGERPKGMTIDRIDSAGNYEPSNCRWATIHEQNRHLDYRHRSRTGFPGVVPYFRDNSRYSVTITVNNRTQAVGTYDSIDEAVSARMTAEDHFWN